MGKLSKEILRDDINIIEKPKSQLNVIERKEPKNEEDENQKLNIKGQELNEKEKLK